MLDVKELSSISESLYNELCAMRIACGDFGYGRYKQNLQVRAQELVDGMKLINTKLMQQVKQDD
jgi:hypothetical protein